MIDDGMPVGDPKDRQITALRAENERLRAALEEVRVLVFGANRSEARYPLARAALLAGLKAWPGAKHVTEYYLDTGDYFKPSIILPLTEKQND